MKVDIQTGADSGHKEKNATPRAQKAANHCHYHLRNAQGIYSAKNGTETAARRRPRSISNHCLVLFDGCELDKLPELCAAIKFTLLSTPSVSVAADSLK